MIDITYMTTSEIASMKSIFCSCPICEQHGFDPSDMIEHKGQLVCEECFTIEMLYKIGSLELEVKRACIGGWECTKKEWDLGVPIANGNTIIEAIDSFLEDIASRHGILTEDIKEYSWS